MLRKTLMIATALLLSTPGTARADTPWGHPFGRDWYTALARCETGNNPRHSTKSYVGAFGFYRGTWDMFADTPNRRAPRLTWRQQALVLDRAFFFGHGTQPPVGPWGHGCYKKLRHAQEAVCKHKNHKIRRWCR